MTGPETLAITPRGEREIVITRSFAAPRELVFRAYTEPDLVRRWLGPRSWHMVECDIDLRAGGAWRYVMHGPEGAVMVLGGVFSAVTPPERLVTTEWFDDNWTGGETLSTTTFTEQLDTSTPSTVLTTTTLYVSAQARDAALQSGMDVGVAEGFERLDEVLVQA